MKKISTFLLFSIIIFSLTQTSYAIIFLYRTGFYLAGSGSYDWSLSNNCSINTTVDDVSIFREGAVRPNSSFNGNLSIGYYMDQWRIEVEGNYRNKNGNTNFSSNGVTADDFGFLPEFSTMANVYYDIPMIEGSGFYLGAGVGAAYSQIAVSGLIKSSVEDTRFAYQLMGGIFYDINCSVTITLGYRFFGTTAPEETTFYGDGVTAIVNGEGSPIIQSLELGIRLALPCYCQ